MIKKVIILLSILAPFILYFFYIKLIKVKNKKYPLKFLSLISIILVVLSLGYLRFYDNYSPNLTKPNISLKPIEVLTIQLNSLQRNNIPFNDAGIEQVWEFAHPSNKKITGPLEKFKKMIYSDSYKILISHVNNETIVLKETQKKFVYKVFVLSEDKKKYYYIWQIEKVSVEGKLKNCWMTTQVSGPTYLGEII